MRRKFLSVVLCVCMMLTMAPFAFAAKESDTSTTNTQEQAPVANSSSGGSGGSTTSVSLPNNNTGNLTISKDNAVLDGSGHTYTNGTITVTAANVTIQNLTFGDKAALVVNTTGKFTLTGCTFTPTTAYTKGSNNQTLTSVRTAVTLNVGEAVVTNNTFDGVTGGYYNAIEFGIGPNQNNLSKATISGNAFNKAIKNNYFNFYNMTADAVIDITGNHFLLAKKGSNAIRISNFRNVSGVTFNVNNNEYTYANDSDESQYEGFILLEDYSPKGDTVQDFSGITININNLTSPSNAKQLFYVYDDQDGIIARNQPIVKGDSSISKFCSARIGDTYYRTLTDAYAALPRGTAAAPAEATTITLLKDSAGGGIGSDTDKYMNYVIDFKGHTYTVGAPAVGSTGTVSQGIRVLKGSTAKFMNGTLKAANYNDLVQVVHTYGNVTFQDFTVDASEDTYAWAAVEPDNGTLNILGDSSILARTGNYGLYVAFWPRGGYTDGTTVTIDTTGKITGKLAYEWDDVADISKQQTESKAILNIENGNFDITGIETLFTSSIPVEKKIAKINISNGYFSVDPSNYCVSGKTGISTGRADYPYTVGTKPENTEPAPVETATVPAKVSDNASQDVIDAANAMDDGADLAQNNVIEAAAKSVADNNLVKATDTVDGKTITKTLDDLAVNNSTTVSDNNVQVIYQTYVDVQVNDVKKITGDAITELEVILTPMYRIIATTNNVYQTGKYIVDKDQSDTHNPEINAIQIGDAQKLTLPTSNYTVTLALPNSFAEDGARLSIKHTKDNGSIEYYTGSVTSTTDNTQTPAPTTYYVTFTTNGFSPFTIYASSASVASIGSDENEKVYPTLQAAIDAANDNDTITLKQDCAENVTVSRNVKFTLNNGGKSFTGSITAGSRYTLTQSGNTYTVTRQSSSSSGSTSTTYDVNVNAATNGAVAADKKTASKGTTVTVTASPSKGYVVDAVKVVDKDGKDVAVTGKDGKYVFTMPASAVTVTGSFKAETPAPVALPFTDVKSGNWFYDAVKYAYEQGLMTGTSATTFAPNGTMNRAMIVTVLYRLEKSPAVTGASKFTDVPAGQWYSDAVAWAAANKIVNGYDETTFGPMNAVTREQMAAILFRYEQVKGLENVTLEENLNRFPDQNKISAYAIPALQWAVGQKIINGNADGTLDPTGTATRAQVAQIFTNLLNK